MNLTTVAEPRAAVPVYVLADDGKLYRDPLVSGNGWQLLFTPESGSVLLLSEGMVRGRCRQDVRGFAERFLRSLLRADVAIDDLHHASTAVQPHWRFRVSLAAPPPA